MLDNMFGSAAICIARAGFAEPASWAPTGRSKQAPTDKAEEILAFFDLPIARTSLASNLPHGLQRALGMASHWPPDPKLIAARRALHRHEPGRDPAHDGAGAKVRDRGVTVAAGRARHAGGHGPVRPHHGAELRQLLTEGTPEEVRTDPDVIEAYLGSAEHAA